MNIEKNPINAKIYQYRLLYMDAAFFDHKKRAYTLKTGFWFFKKWIIATSGIIALSNEMIKNGRLIRLA